MVRRRGKPISFDAMIKFFMQNYEIPTKKDVEKLTERLDRIEKLLKSAGVGTARRRTTTKRAAENNPRGRGGSSAVIQVLDVIKEFKQGAGVSDIKAKTGFGDKKIRNIIYRLHRDGRIQRKDRGTYVAG